MCSNTKHVLNQRRRLAMYQCREHHEYEKVRKPVRLSQADFTVCRAARKDYVSHVYQCPNSVAIASIEHLFIIQMYFQYDWD